MVEGGGCVCGWSQYLMQLVTSTYLRWWSRGADVCVDGASISYSLLHQPTWDDGRGGRMCVWTEPVSHAACYINLPEMMVEGGGCVCGRSQYLMQWVTFVAVKLQQVVACVMCIKLAVAQILLVRHVWCHRWRCVGLVSEERHVVWLERLGYSFSRHALVPAIQTLVLSNDNRAIITDRWQGLCKIWNPVRRSVVI